MRHALTLALLFFATEVRSSEYNEGLELPELVRASTMIAIVEADSPPEKKTPIDFPGRKNVSGEPLEPFIRVQRRYVVREVLKGSKALVGTKLEVDVASYETRKTVHEKYFFEGVRKIPIFRSYQPSSSPKGPRVIAFLVGRSERWEFTADGSIEATSTRAEIDKLIANAKVE